MVPNPPGKRAIAWLERTNISLRVKKYLKLMSFLSLAMILLVACSKGSRMARPKLGSGPAPPWPGGHDPAAGAGDDHPARVRHFLGEFRRLAVVHVVFQGAGAAEDADLSHIAIRGEDFQGVAQFLERFVDQLDVAAIGLVAEELHGVFDDLPDHVAVRNVAQFFDERAASSRAVRPFRPGWRRAAARWFPGILPCLRVRLNASSSPSPHHNPDDEWYAFRGELAMGADWGETARVASDAAKPDFGLIGAEEREMQFGVTEVLGDPFLVGERAEECVGKLGRLGFQASEILSKSGQALLERNFVNAGRASGNLGDSVPGLMGL